MLPQIPLSQKLLIKPGDVIWAPPGVTHWHGATEATTMTHIAIQDIVDGRPVDGWNM
jgi:quercetin dioxygenase-like cupin family protein